MNDQQPHPDRRLAGLTAIVTGAGHGIGRVYAMALAGRGAAVAVADLDGEAASKVAAEIEGEGGQATAIPVDVADWDSCQEMATTTMETFGRIDVLVNNAAIFATIPLSRGGFESIPLDEWDRVMTVNVRGTWLPCRAVVPHMRQQGYGKIVTISSGTALKGGSGRIHYVASKAAILGFTKNLAREVGKDGITVNCVAPGSTLSEADPSEETLQRRAAATADRAIPRVQRPEDLVGAVVFFASRDSDFITGQTLVVDGGSHMH